MFRVYRKNLSLKCTRKTEKYKMKQRNIITKFIIFWFSLVYSLSISRHVFKIFTSCLSILLVITATAIVLHKLSLYKKNFLPRQHLNISKRCTINVAKRQKYMQIRYFKKKEERKRSSSS